MVPLVSMGAVAIGSVDSSEPVLKESMDSLRPNASLVVLKASLLLDAVVVSAMAVESRKKV